FSIGDISAGFEYAKVTDYRDPKHKQYGVIGRDGRFILPMSEHKVAVLDMKGEAATPIFTLYKDGKVLAYDTKGRPLADSGFQKMKYVAVGEEKAYLLKRDGLTDIVSEDIQLIYSDLDVGVAADPEQFARLKKATGFSAAMIAGILNTNEELKCFAYEEAGCLCRVARPETGDYSIYRNGASLLKQDETIYNFNSEKGFLVFQNKDNKTGAKNRLGEVVIPPGNDTFGNSFLFNAIVVKRGDRYFFYDADGKQTDEDGYAFYDNYRLKRSEDGGYAFHNKDGVPLTGFEFEEIVRIVHAGCFLGVKASGYSLLSPEGEELLFLECDTITDILKNRVFLEYRKGGKTGILHKDGQAIIPALYDTISLTHQYSGITFFSARKANGAIDIYNPEGKIFPIDDARKPGLRVTPSSDGYFSIYNPETGETEFYNPEMELIISIKIGSQSHSSNLAEYGIFKIDDYYFNYRNGVSFKND
ncbi:MAG: hypothetical protein KDD04_07295, partial [Sinomicrobium sp.]|nr:hypothetical protein [Sinomicrobium sp.]